MGFRIKFIGNHIFRCFFAHDMAKIGTGIIENLRREDSPVLDKSGGRSME